MERCATCKHFQPQERASHSGSTPIPLGIGSCSRWHTGYGTIELASNEVRVEDDEGWGMMMGPYFGCVLHEPKS